MLAPNAPVTHRLRSLAYRTLMRRPFIRWAPSVDCGAIQRSVKPDALTVYCPEAIARASQDLTAGSGLLFTVARTILALADEALTRGPFSVTDKTSLPVSHDPHDYWHPAPYFWPNPKKKDGIPYIERDGQRVPGTRLYEPESERYDRSRIQRLFDDSALLALAWKISGDTRYAKHAAGHLVHWFISPASRMNPHLEYAQIILTSKKGKWSSAGIIETKDLYYYLDAVRLLRAGGYIDETTNQAFREWLHAFKTWLVTSRHGRRECAKPNNHGLLYDLQLSAIAVYLGDTDLLATIFRRARPRLFQHFEPDGRQPYELVRTLSAHYCAFNLQGWINYGRLARRCGYPLWETESPDGRSLERALAWLLHYNQNKTWPFRQIAPFDWSRLTTLATASDQIYNTRHKDHAAAAPVCFHPHDGIPPAWQLTSCL